MVDFKDEISGYSNNLQIMKSLNALVLNLGEQHIGNNMILCYQKLIELNLVGSEEMPLLKAWLKDIKEIL